MCNGSDSQQDFQLRAADFHGCGARQRGDEMKLLGNHVGGQMRAREGVEELRRGRTDTGKHFDCGDGSLAQASIRFADDRGIAYAWVASQDGGDLIREDLETTPVDRV